MKTLIVTESYFGNTARIADAIAAGLRSRGADVDVVDAASAPTPAPGVADLVLVGAPTHYRGLPSPASRQQAEARGGAAVTAGVAEWLDTLPAGGGTAGVFDTVSSTSFFAGSAAKVIAKRMRRKSFTVVGRRSFVVTDAAGPSLDDELAGARQWGESLAS